MAQADAALIGQIHAGRQERRNAEREAWEQLQPLLAKQQVRPAVLYYMVMYLLYCTSLYCTD